MKFPLSLKSKKHIFNKQFKRYIELENSTTKMISYYVRYEGSSDFVIDEINPIKIEGKSNYRFKVQFVSRVS